MRHDAYENLILGGFLAVTAIVYAVKFRETSRLTIVCWLVAAAALMIVAWLYLQGLVAPVWVEVSRYAVFGTVGVIIGAGGFSAASTLGWTKWFFLVWGAGNVLWAAYVGLGACLR